MTTLHRLGIGGACVLAAVALASCAANTTLSTTPTQQQAQQVFTGFATGTSQVTSGSETTTQTGPPTWTYEYTFYLSNGGSITEVLSSNTDLSSSLTTGESGSYNGTITFTNVSAYGYTYNGTINFTGSFTTSSASNSDLILTESYSYTGSLSVSGNSVSSMAMNFSAMIGIDTTAGTIESGPTYTGTITLNGQATYNVNSLSIAKSVDPLTLLRFAQKIGR